MYYIAITKEHTRKGNKHMASIEFIQKELTVQKTKIEKLNKKLERIEIAKASNYEEKQPVLL